MNTNGHTSSLLDIRFSYIQFLSLRKVKVVILGQDPYPNPGQYYGVCFSVPDGVAIPGSLSNIFKEIHQDLGKPVPTSGNLDRWVAQGVFPLNSVLTVRAHETGSHRNMGWEIFTDAVIRKLSENGRI